MVKLVKHRNFIGHEINESLENYGDNDRKIYCKKLHSIRKLSELPCESCKYFAGSMMGSGRVCVWNDWVDYDVDEVIVKFGEAQKELFRVSTLIDDGIIKKG